MKKRASLLVALLTIIAVIPIPFATSIEPVSAAAKTLSWSIVDTPRDRNIDPSGLIAQSSEINALSLGPDSLTIYCADTDNTSTNRGKLFKSTDAGATFADISNPLSLASARLPVWHIAVAPDDPNFVLVVTDNSTTFASPQGPRQVYFSIDGGNTWQNTGLPTSGANSLGINEYISCIGISRTYGSNNEFRDIAVGTRSIAGPGQVLSIQYSSTSFGTWQTQTGLIDSVNSLRFSPHYDTDNTIVVVSCNTTDSFIHFGSHKPDPTNQTSWDDTSYGIGYPVNLGFGNLTQVISTDLQLPTDFTATDISQRGCFASIQTDLTSSATGVFYVNTSAATPVFKITPPVSPAPPNPNRISSIAYSGSEASGILLAGEATADPARGLVNIWQCSNAQTVIVGGATWTKSDEFKSPSGGGSSGQANAILNFSADLQTCYCATSSDNSTRGGTGWLPGQWPFSKLASVPLDESALSKTLDMGLSWNQVNLIDTRIFKLSDSAALEEVTDAAPTTEPSVLYLATVDNATDNMTIPTYIDIDSVWRSTSDPLGRTWERILVRHIRPHTPPPNGDNILRINPRENTGSQALVFADLYTNTILYSSDRGQLWELVPTDASVNDISLLDDITFYVLEDFQVSRFVRGAGTGGGWLQEDKINTQLTAPAHTIAAPLTSPNKSEIVLVGTGKDGYNYQGYIAWIDFSVNVPKFTALKELPTVGNVHVIADCKFDQNWTIYASVNNGTSDGIIYRWVLKTSIDWDQLDPPNRAFYGIENLNDVLYGGWNFNSTTTIVSGGVDRTLYSRSRVPPPPEWDELTYGLPILGDPGYPVNFTREPTSLKVSENTYNTLWTIDNKGYVFENKTGSLWSFVDSVARLGPQPTAPPPGSFIGADPVTGRAQQVDLMWRQMRDVFGYDLMLAKDVNFSLLLTQDLPFFPVDNLTGAWLVVPAKQLSPAAWIPPGNLEAGRSYYWKVRASRALDEHGMALGGQAIHSPWSPAMYFSVKPGFIVGASSTGPKLMAPLDGPCSNCKAPVRFSWTPMKNTRKYEFTLAADAAMKEIVFKTTTSTTGYEYSGSLELSKPYYWQVKAVVPVASDPSAVGTFTLTPDVPPVAQKVAAGQAPLVSSSNFWIWIAILIVFILMFLINVFIIVSHRRD